MVVFAGPPVPLLSSVRPARDPPQPDRPPAMGIVRAAEVAPSPPSPRLGQTHRESYCYCCCCLCVDPRDSGGESSLAEKTRGQTPRKINSRKEEVLGTNSRVPVRFFFLLLLELESIPILRADLVAVPGSDRLTRSPRPLKPSACEVSTSSSGRGDCGPAKPPRIFFIFFFQQPTWHRIYDAKWRDQRHHVLHGLCDLHFLSFFARLFQLAKNHLPIPFFLYPQKEKSMRFQLSGCSKTRSFPYLLPGGEGGVL